MHFLCLHGLGTNSQILEVQTAALRHELGDSHTFDYAEGTLPCPIDSELAPYFPDEDEGYAYFNPSDPKSLTTTLDNLEAFILSEGPFDAILAFSHGAQLAATYLVERGKSRSSPGAGGIQFAIFFSGGIPYSSSVSAGVLAPMAEIGGVEEAVRLHLPTAHIWGQNDTSYPGTSQVLSQLCVPEWRAIYVHKGAHEIPGPRSRVCLLGAAEAIRKTIELSLGLH